MWVYLHPGKFYSYFPLDLVRSQEFCATETEMTSSLAQIPVINDRHRLKVIVNGSSILWCSRPTDNINNLINCTHLRYHNQYFKMKI